MSSLHSPSGTPFSKTLCLGLCDIAVGSVPKAREVCHRLAIWVPSMIERESEEESVPAWVIHGGDTRDMLIHQKDRLFIEDLTKRADIEDDGSGNPASLWLLRRLRRGPRCPFGKGR